MSEAQYKSKKMELADVQEALEAALEVQSVAAELGDLSENEEYSTSRAEAERLLREKDRLEAELYDVEIVRPDSSPHITLGSVIEVCKVDESGTPISKVRTFRLEASGNTVTQGILGANSSLGRTILNGTSGIYLIPDNGGIRYHVRKKAMG